MPQPVKFGLNVDPNTGGLPIAERIAAIADDSGLELVGIQDHPYNADFADTFTIIAWLAARTRNVHFFPNVANLPLRPPAMLAKQAATIDVLSGGRNGRPAPRRRAGARRAQRGHRHHPGQLGR
jgi:alkanesulfonate monooxygenase SsuD/methylene tetrahydromethanopterin reductase-like flavin-dependent oxidoreductase (luciferase family)